MQTHSFTKILPNNARKLRDVISKDVRVSVCVCVCVCARGKLCRHTHTHTQKQKDRQRHVGGFARAFPTRQHTTCNGFVTYRASFSTQTKTCNSLLLPNTTPPCSRARQEDEPPHHLCPCGNHPGPYHRLPRHWRHHGQPCA